MDENVHRTRLTVVFPADALNFGATAAAVGKLPSERASGKWDV